MFAQKDLLSELQNMVSNFLSHQEQTICGPTSEFHALLQKTLQEVISNLFLGEINQITEIKQEISFIAETMAQKQSELADKMSEFLIEIPEELQGESYLSEFGNLKDAINEMVIEMEQGNKGEKWKRTTKKQEECKKTPKEKEGFFGNRPKAANVLFIEERIKEMYPNGSGIDAIRDNLKSLLEEWRMLEKEKKEAFEARAEAEFIRFYLAEKGRI